MFISMLALCLTGAVRAEVVGAFQTQNGTKAVVTAADRSGHTDVHIVLNRGKNRKEVTLTRGWSLRHEALAGSKTNAIEVQSALGAFVLPPFGAAFMLRPGEAAKIQFRDLKGATQDIVLPIRGGEIRSFRVLPDGLELLVYDQESINETDPKGRKLFGLAPKGQNVLIQVKATGASEPTNLGSSDSHIYWAEKNRIYRVDEATGKFVKP